ncbi:MAG TPA: helix-turn-helix domain-containing protein [Acidimicrobiales bacterium]|jgi:excisionase family DNA binding protein|nr:helix-turn-helix domain-containing protein [Acidimicrobiales bacterium]
MTERGPEIVPLAAAAQRLGIGVTTAYELVKRGELPVPVQRIGRQMKVLASDLDDYLAPPRAAEAPPSSQAHWAEHIERHIRDLRHQADELERFVARELGRS